MKIENPTYRSQVQVVRGDCSQPDLGMDEADVNRIKYKINVVIHLAAITTDNGDSATLRAAVCTNVRATRDLIVLSKCFQNLKVGTSARTIAAVLHGPRYPSRVLFPQRAASRAKRRRFLRGIHKVYRTNFSNFTYSNVFR